MYQNKLYQQKIKSYFSAIQSSLLSIHSILFQVQLSSSFYQQLDRIYTNCFYEYPPSLFSSPSLFPSMIQNRLVLFSSLFGIRSSCSSGWILLCNNPFWSPFSIISLYFKKLVPGQRQPLLMTLLFSLTLFPSF